MAINKSELANHLYRNFDCSREDSSTTIEALLKNVKQTLESGENLLISGFGKFILKDKKSRRGSNPATGKDLILDARRTVIFKCSKNLQEKLNVEMK